jgi:predicted transcriptional regulator
MLAPPGRKWMFSQENISEMESMGLIKFNEKGKPVYSEKSRL